MRERASLLFIFYCLPMRVRRKRAEREIYLRSTHLQLLERVFIDLQLITFDFTINPRNIGADNNGSCS